LGWGVTNTTGSGGGVEESSPSRLFLTSAGLRFVAPASIGSRVEFCAIGSSLGEMSDWRRRKDQVSGRIPVAGSAAFPSFHSGKTPWTKTCLELLLGGFLKACSGPPLTLKHKPGPVEGGPPLGFSTHLDLRLPQSRGRRKALCNDASIEPLHQLRCRAIIDLPQTHKKRGRATGKESLSQSNKPLATYVLSKSRLTSAQNHQIRLQLQIFYFLALPRNLWVENGC
jgi:hypothetical protein